MGFAPNHIFRRYNCSEIISLLKALLLIAAFQFPAAAKAEVFTTLDMMQEAALARDDIKEAIIDSETKALMVIRADGLELIFYPDNLDRVLSSLATEDERRAEVARFVAQLINIADEDAQPAEPHPQQVLPVVSVANLYGEVTTSMPDSPPLLEEPFALGLSVYYAIDGNDTLSYLTSDDLVTLDRSETELFEIAKDNLRRKAVDMTLETLSEDPWIAAIILDSVYEGSLLTLPEIWDGLAEKHSRLGLIYPGRGTMFVFDADAPEARAVMSEYLVSEMPRMPYPVSEVMFMWSGTGWVVLSP